MMPLTMSWTRRAFLARGAAATVGLSVVALRLEDLTAGPSGLSISTDKTVITPGINDSPNNPYIGGYGCNFNESIRRATGTYAPLYARCIVLWNGGRPKAIVSADVLGWPRSMHQTIRRRVAGLATWSSSDFILTATHTHNGPTLVERLDPYIAYGLSDLSAVTAYSNWLTNRIVSLVSTALHAAQTRCTLDYQVLDADFAYNREGLPYAERDVPTLVARDLAGRPAAVLFSYGCHAVSAGSQTLFDSDYPGATVALIEANTPAFAMYVQGAAGDQNPAGPRGWALRNHLGHDLGIAIVKAMKTLGRAITGPISTRYSEIQLPLDILDTPANLQAMQDDYERRAAAPLTAWYQRHAKVMIWQVKNHSFAMTVPLPLQVWKLQGSPILRLALTGGELVSHYAVHIRKKYNGPNGIIVGGYVNEVPAYIPSNELLPAYRASGSYAGGWDRCR